MCIPNPGSQIMTIGGLISLEGILYGCSRHISHSEQLPPADRSALLAATATLHCPPHVSVYDLKNATCKIFNVDNKDDVNIKPPVSASEELSIKDDVITEKNFSDYSDCQQRKRIKLDVDDSFVAEKTNIKEIFTNSVQNCSKDDKVTQLSSYYSDGNENKIVLSKEASGKETLAPMYYGSDSATKTDSLKLACYCPTAQCKGLELRCPILSSHMRGIFTPGSLVEIFGESATGKTQFALSLALSTVCPVEENKQFLNRVAYICTEGLFPYNRLKQMVETASPDADLLKKVSDFILVQHIPDLASLCDSVRYQLSALLRLHNSNTSHPSDISAKQNKGPSSRIPLVILDSITAPFRAEGVGSMSRFGAPWSDRQTRLGNDALCLWSDRQARLGDLGYRLRQLAVEYHCCIVVINQVTSRFDSLDLYGLGDGVRVNPALGLCWSQWLMSRLMLQRNTFIEQDCETFDDEKKEKSVRLIRVVQCPWLPRKTVKFVVNSSGVQGIEV